MAWTHRFRCVGVTSNPNVAGHMSAELAATMTTHSSEPPRLRPICPSCMTAMEFVSSAPDDRPGHSYGDLTAVEHEALANTSEELAEAIAEIGKAMRHGLESHHPNRPLVTNRRLIAQELGQVLALVDVLVDLGIVTRAAVNASRDDKTRRLGQWLHHIEIDAAGVARRKIL